MSGAPANESSPGSESLAAILPRCAVTCIASAMANGTCAAHDVACTCTNPKYQAQVGGCLLNSCTIKEILVTQNASSAICGISPVSNHSFGNAIIVFAVLAGVAVALRLIARLTSGFKLWYEDMTTIAAFVGCGSFTGIILASKDLGMGTSIWAVPFDNITKIFQFVYISMHIYNVSRFLTRTSILLFYFHIFHVGKRLWSLILPLIVCVAIFITYIVLLLLICQPLSYSWTRWDGEHQGHCVNNHALFWALNTIGIVFDLWCILLPIPFVLRLTLSRKKKIMSSLMFCVGLCVFIVTLYRLSVINQFVFAKDPIVDYVPLATSTAIEIDMALICACMPSFHILLRRLFPRLLGSTRGASYANPSHVGSKYHGGPNTSTAPRSGIRVTHMTSVFTSTPDDSTTDIGNYYSLNDLESSSETKGVGQKPKPVMIRPQISGRTGLAPRI